MRAPRASWQIVYEPQIAGEYMLAVTLRTEPVLGSPATIRLSAVTPMLIKTALSGTGLSQCVAGTPSTFSLTFYDEYDGLQVLFTLPSTFFHHLLLPSTLATCSDHLLVPHTTRPTAPAHRRPNGRQIAERADVAPEPATEPHPTGMAEAAGARRCVAAWAI